MSFYNGWKQRIEIVSARKAEYLIDISRKTKEVTQGGYINDEANENYTLLTSNYDNTSAGSAELILFTNGFHNEPVLCTALQRGNFSLCRRYVKHGYFVNILHSELYPVRLGSCDKQDSALLLQQKACNRFQGAVIHANTVQAP